MYIRAFTFRWRVGGALKDRAQAEICKLLADV